MEVNLVEVLGHGRRISSNHSHDALPANVNDINSDDHSLGLSNLGARNDSEEILVGLRIDLSKKTRHGAHVLADSPHRISEHELTGKAELVKSLLSSFVLIISLGQNEHNFYVRAILALEGFFDTVRIVITPTCIIQALLSQLRIVGHLDVNRLSSENHAQSPLCLSECVDNLVGKIVVLVVVDQGPLIAVNFERLSDRYSSVVEIRNSYLAMGRLNHRRLQFLGVNSKHLLLHLNAPVLEHLRVGEFLGESVYFFISFLSCGNFVPLNRASLLHIPCKTLGKTCLVANLSGKINSLVGLIYIEQRLVRNEVQFPVLLEVLEHGDFLPSLLVHESIGAWSELISHAINLIALAVMLSDHSNSLVVHVGRIKAVENLFFGLPLVHLGFYLVKDGYGVDEFCAAVDFVEEPDCSHGRLQIEARPCLQVVVLYSYLLLGVEKLGEATHLVVVFFLQDESYQIVDEREH